MPLCEKLLNKIWLFVSLLIGELPPTQDFRESRNCLRGKLNVH